MFTQEEKELLLEVLSQVIWDSAVVYSSKLWWERKVRRDPSSAKYVKQESEYWQSRADLANSILKKAGLDNPPTDIPENTEDNDPSGSKHA